LLTQDRVEEARKNFHALRVGTLSEEEIDAQFTALHESLRQMPEQGKFKELFLPVNRKRTAVII
jgi:MFS transporter, SP family, sugar:H+ symporter